MRYPWSAIEPELEGAPMRRLFRLEWVAVTLLIASLPVAAQQPAPPPAFAEPNLTANGARSMAASCATCHGTNGKPAAESSIAPLAGRSREDLVQIMAQFKEGKRPATLMHQIAKGYSDAEIAAIADYYSKQPR
jgi:cytochrome subunit of sulfide dehydrogenase